MGVELTMWQREFIAATYGPQMYARDRVFWTPNLLYRPGEYRGHVLAAVRHYLKWDGYDIKYKVRLWFDNHDPAPAVPPVDLEAVTWSPRAELQIAQANADTYMVKLSNVNFHDMEDHIDTHRWAHLKAVHDMYLVTDSDNDKPTNSELREALVDVLNNGDTKDEDDSLRDALGAFINDVGGEDTNYAPSQANDHLTPAVRDALTKGGWNSAGIGRIHSSEDETTPVYHVYHDNGREDDVKRPWPKDDVGESDDLIDEDDDALTTEDLHDMHIPGQPPEPTAEDLDYARQHAGVVAAYQRYGFSRQESMALLFQELHADLAREIYNPF